MVEIFILKIIRNTRLWRYGDFDVFYLEQSLTWVFLIPSTFIYVVFANTLKVKDCSFERRIAFCQRGKQNFKKVQCIVSQTQSGSF